MEVRIQTMIVDDDPNGISQLKEYLTSFPYIEVIAEANSEKEAILKVRENEVDLLFLDIEMGDMTGMDLVAYLKTEEQEIALIFVTGHPGFVLEGYAYQPIDYLMKPINFLGLERAVRTARERI